MKPQLVPLFAGVAANFFEITPETSVSPPPLNQTPRVRTETHELFRPEQISMAASLQKELIHELISDLLKEDVKAEIKRSVSERARVADVEKWDTLLTVPDLRLDRLGNWALAFLATKRAEGKFELQNFGQSDMTVKVSPLGLTENTRDLAVALRSVQVAYKQAFQAYQKKVTVVDQNWVKKFRSPSPAIYEFRQDLACGQMQIGHVAKRRDLVSTQKYLNFRIPLTFVRVHLTNPRAHSGPALEAPAAHGALGPYFQEPYMLGYSDWRLVSADHLEIIGIDAVPAGRSVFGLGSEIMKNAANALKQGCPQAAIISREGFIDHCVHTGDELSHHKAFSLPPADSYALKCAALYPDGTIVVARRYQDLVDPKTGAFSREERVVGNLCTAGRWSADLPIHAHA